MLLAGCEKAIGDVIDQYLRVKAEPLHQVKAYALLLDFNENLLIISTMFMPTPKCVNESASLSALQPLSR